ncbi:MAG: malectin domain-containing carbohydrate-binding protein, partial [Thermoanaerobaculia bacterium]
GVEDLAEPPYGPLPGHRTKTGGWLDYDRDGCVDLYLGHFVLNSAGHPANRDRLYRNRCDGTFEDVTALSGVNPGTDPMTYRAALAFLGADLDGDLWPDLWAVNTSGDQPSPLHHDLIYRNNGDGTFTLLTDIGPYVGIGDDAQAGMGIDAADVDLDGDWDVYLSDLLNTNLDALPLGNPFYRSYGDGTFEDNSAPAAGIVGNDSWPVNFFDVDHDGDEDLYVGTAGGVPSDYLYINDGTGNFVDVAAAMGIFSGNRRGGATADYDRDGDLDLAVINQAGPLQVYRNDTAGAGNWLQLRLFGRQSNGDAIGTLVEAWTDGGRQMRQVKGGSSAHSQDGLPVHFGLAEAPRVDAVEVHWPSGRVDRLLDVGGNGLVNVVEGMTLAPVTVRVNAGSGAFHSAAGELFVPDEAFTSGAAGFLGGEGLRDYIRSDILGTEDDALYQSARAGATFGYAFERLPVGRYEVVLHFTEAAANAPGQRLFDVLAEGQVVLDNFDIYAAAGGRRRAHQETLLVEVVDGRLDLEFQVVVGMRAIVHALEVRQVEFRLNAGGLDYLTTAGVPFSADLELLSGGIGYDGGLGLFEYYHGDVLGTEDDPLYQSAHAGASFAYGFDGIPNGEYEVTLHFMETAAMAAGQRVFDVSAEGDVVLDDFDIFAAVGARRTAHQETFVVALADGRLDLGFDVVVGPRAIVHAIDVRYLGAGP